MSGIAESNAEHGFQTTHFQILFDGNLAWKYTDDQRKRVALFSDDFAQYSKWNGVGTIPEADKKRLEQVIDSVHGINCKIRFWDAPNAWEEFIGLKVDYINTDHIRKLEEFLKKNKQSKIITLGLGEIELKNL